MQDGSKTVQTLYKKQHPRETANFLSRMFFCWTIPTFVRGFKKDFDEGDLCGPLKEHSSCLLGDKLEKSWTKEVGKSKPSLSRAILHVFAFDIVWTGAILVFIECLKYSQPICLAILISYYIPNQTTITKEEAYISACFIVVISLCNALLGHWYMLYLQHLGMKIRVACSALIYRKSLKLSKTALGATTIGQLVNLLSNDVSRFDYAMTHFHSLWVAPSETLIILGFLYYQVGVAGIAGILFLILFIPFQMYLGKMSSRYRLKTALKTDERVHLMSQIISGIQVIKMYTWEKPFAKLVEIARKREIKLIRATSYIKAILVSLVMFNARFAIFLTILTYVLIGEIPDAKFVFVVTAYYNVMRQSLVQGFPRAITQVSEASISIQRLKEFLLYDEVEMGEFKTDKTSLGINLVGVSANWSDTEKTLSNIDLSVNDHELVAIIGEVGSGKTSLLQVILREIPGVQGSVVVNGQISYASQEPWLFSGTIKDNILFGQPLNVKRYRDVVKSCDLERDFSVFTHGDNTIVGERGVTLSGGQRARISLARALYKEADIYLLDDPLSAVDAHVGKRLFEEAICGFLQGKCVILVTHQLQFLGNVNKIAVLENGQIAAIGNYQELQTSGKDFSRMLKDTSGKEKTVEPNKVAVCKEVKDKSKKTEENLPAQNKETRSVGNISKKVYKAYVKAGGNWCYSFLILLTFFMTQLSASGADYFLSFWVNTEEERTRNDTGTDLNEFFTTQNSVYIYSSIVVAIVVISLTRALSFFKFCMNASTNLHSNMFNKIVYGKMIFFNTNPSGRILNRFSKDMGSIDEQLPTIIIDMLQNGLSVLGICIVIAIVNFWILIPTFIIFILFYLLRVFYLATSRNVKRLEGITKSPVFTHLNSTIQGLTTIRAFGAQEVLKSEFDHHQDLHSSAYYLFLGCTRTFGFWIDFLCVIYIGLVTMSFLLMGTETHGGNVGLAITQAVGLTGMLQWGMRQWSELENQMTAVERVIEYTEIEHEVDEGTKKPPNSWPENGNVEFKNVSLRYSSKDQWVLRNVNFKVNGGEKIGIVGRTGAGKSSIIIALFQIADTEGDIIIDELNIKEIPLKLTRSKISIIPQEPVLFSGTLRKNLDPFDEHKDDEIWKAIEEVELKNLANDLPSGLNSRISEGGSNLSVGQRQLLCLARAILRKNKILVLDEATANVDPKTDFFIQKTIREKFSDCTVLTIAHRLHTVIDSDKILVIDNGKVAAFDDPYALLCEKDGIFYKLVEQTGETMMNSLLEIARKRHT